MIVFTSTRNIDGTDSTNYPTNPPPAWPFGTSNIWRVNVDGTGLMPLTRSTAVRADSDGPRWSPDRSRIVFASSRKLDGTDAAILYYTSNIWQMNADDSGLMPLTSATAMGADSYGPQWSPDGSRIIFSSRLKLDGSDAPNSASNIWRVNADGSGLAPLTCATAMGADSLHPQWSADGSRIAFASSRKLDGTDAANLYYTSNIWQMNADGSGLMPLTSATARGADSYSPQWSPEGTTIAFQSSRSTDGADLANGNGGILWAIYNIWRVDADGGSLMALTRDTDVGAGTGYRGGLEGHLRLESFQWSPDGSGLIFSSSRKLDGTGGDFARHIWGMNADGSNLTPLTRATALGTDSRHPQWSPDGLRIIFSSGRKLDGTDAANGNFPYITENIWKMNADGSGIVPLTGATAVLADSYNPQIH